MSGPFDKTPEPSALASLDARSREIFRRIVESYLASGEPVGSRSLSRLLPMALSPASIRNIMQDLEELGLIYAPHTSAGRLPTQGGLRFFVDALLEFGGLANEERARIESQARVAAEQGYENALTQTTMLISDLTRGAGLVLTTKDDVRMRHIEFVRVEAEKALVVLVGEDGAVENRVIAIPPGISASALTEASNYLNAHARGGTLAEARDKIESAREAARHEIDELASGLVDAGLAFWAGAAENRPQLIVRGQANLIGASNEAQDLERIRLLFADLETQTDVVDLLHRAENGEGVKIFIGSENKLFSLSGSSIIAAPLRGADRRIAGVLGVIGPTRLNYGRIVPMVEYAAQVLGDLRRGPLTFPPEAATNVASRRGGVLEQRRSRSPPQSWRSRTSAPSEMGRAAGVRTAADAARSRLADLCVLLHHRDGHAERRFPVRRRRRGDRRRNARAKLGPVLSLGARRTALHRGRRVLYS